MGLRADLIHIKSNHNWRNSIWLKKSAIAEIIVNIAFLPNAAVVRAVAQAVLMQICLKRRNVLMLFAVKVKAFTVVGNVKRLQIVKQVFSVRVKTTQRPMHYT